MVHFINAVPIAAVLGMVAVSWVAADATAVARARRRRVPIRIRVRRH